MAILKHFTDNDLYKFTIQNAILRLYPMAEARYTFVLRTPRSFPPQFHLRLQQEIDAMASLRLSDEEEQFIREKCYFFDADYLTTLRNYRYKPEQITLGSDIDHLNLTIEGPWHETVLWEVPLMALISELYFCLSNQKPTEYIEKTFKKGAQLKALGAEFSEFGTRRRFSFGVHQNVVQQLKKSAGNYLKGTSNVFLAMRNQLLPMGTHPHEWFMFHGAVNGYTTANRQSLDAWTKVYGPHLGIALTDTYTTHNFFEQFTFDMADHFDGLRWDSGNALEFTDRAIQFYNKHGIDPRTKTIVFSDSLNLQKIQAIKQHIKGRIHDVYGIGTHFTNDVGATPLNMVIKMTHARLSPNHPWKSAVKLSDVPGKHTGEPDEIARCKQILGIG